MQSNWLCLTTFYPGRDADCLRWINMSQIVMVTHIFSGTLLHLPDGNTVRVREQLRPTGSGQWLAVTEEKWRVEEGHDDNRTSG